ncbi:MAG TPA: alpha-D-ribose 1-methylphosphonate 5-triphosphate diphosphatase, partial [Methanocella sp.]|nr:alpha-D-ribose 1-methylphosphonate 5-triphosphate diphosphatase [Methanocella sp.]
MKYDGRSMVIENAKVVTPERVLENACVKIVDGVIADISTRRLNGCSKKLDIQGRYLLPGFIDLHSDAIEKEIEPRTSACFPANMAIFEMDKKLAGCGITTMYHSLSFDPRKDAVRESAMAAGIIREVNRLAPMLGVRNRVHARFEISNAMAIPYLEQLLDEGSINLFSLTDHTPGQGQYRDLDAYKRISSQVFGLDYSTVTDIIDRQHREAVPLRTDYIWKLVDRCHSLRVPIASHDDDTCEKLDIVEEMGIRITEFPITMEVAGSAFSRNMHILLGAPNVVRGTSTGNNLDAREAIKAGFGNVLCSDYAPMTMIHAVFTLERMGIPLH